MFTSDDYAYSGNEGRATAEYSGPTASGEGPGPYFTRGTGDYGHCEFCGVWTYADRWRGSCGECRWRWAHYPATLPASLAHLRDVMPYPCSAEACYGTSAACAFAR